MADENTPTEAQGASQEWELVAEYGVERYVCGLRAGEKVSLRNDLPIEDHKGKIRYVIPKGQIWSVLTGSRQTPGVVWLLKPDGRRHTWDDDESFFDYFERIDEEANGSGVFDEPAGRN